ncbi:hypothetical protein ACFY19_23840 [Streptosporangium saharense]
MLEHALCAALFRTAHGNLIRQDYFNADILKPSALAGGLTVE